MNTSTKSFQLLSLLIADFCNKIGTTRTRAKAAACPQLVKADIGVLEA
jgi:hypothetical protein